MYLFLLFFVCLSLTEYLHRSQLHYEIINSTFISKKSDLNLYVSSDLILMEIL